MTKKVIVSCLVVLLLGGVAYYSSYQYFSGRFREQSQEIEQKMAELQRETRMEKAEPQEIRSEKPTEESPEILLREPVLSDPASVQTETAEISYYLVEEFGYVNIYTADKESIYEYTNIPIDSLPEDLQEEICTGKGVTSEQELYDFLENYSS